MPDLQATLSRRHVLAGGVILAFAVFRNGAKIGEHHVSFAGTTGMLTATTDAAMTVRLGPVPVFRYHHHAVETRAAGLFRGLATSTSSNGKREQVTAERTDGGVRIDGPAGRTTLAADANPLNHWDQDIFTGPMFNPQTGKPMQIRATRAGPGHWRLRGEAQIDDFYDDAGAWQALKGKLDDGSTVEYRRV